MMFYGFCPVRYDDPLRSFVTIWTPSKVALNRLLRSLWVQHIYWTRLTVNSIVGRLPDEKPTTERLLQNADDFASAFHPYYGSAAASRFGELIRGHLTIAAELVKALKENQTEGCGGCGEALVRERGSNCRLPGKDQSLLVQGGMEENDASSFAAFDPGGGIPHCRQICGKRRHEQADRNAGDGDGRCDDQRHHPAISFHVSSVIEKNDQTAAVIVSSEQEDVSGCSFLSMGNATVNLEPTPTLLTAVSSPPWSCMIFLQMDSPRPVPFSLVV